MNQTNTILGTDEPALTTPTSEERTMAVLSHILCVIGGFLAPLIIYLIKKDESAYIRSHAKESLNFQLTVLLAWIALWIVTMILTFIFFFFSFLGFPLMVLLMIANLVLVIIATIRASENKIYKYPFSIKFVK
jgi:uncharacterized Tic20 family protein